MKMRTRAILVVACAVPAIAMVATRKPHRGPATLVAKTAPKIPAHADSFSLGSVRFKACELPQPHSGATTSAFCASFQVPENWDAPGGRAIELRLALIKSEADAADTDIVVFLDGGPGQAATEDYAVMAGAFVGLRKRHHILLLDQRGTGGSHPLRCKESKDKPDDVGEEKDFDPEEVKRHTRECLAQLSPGSDVSQYNTTVATHDLEALRKALGAPPFDIMGVSYGTRMAQQYLKRYPDGVRSVVLDSVVPNELALGDEHAKNLEDALKAQFTACTATPTCAKAFGDPYVSLYKLRDLLRAKPFNYNGRDPVTNQPSQKRIDSYTLAGLVRIFAYAPETSALLPLSIAEALKGNYAPLAGQNQILKGDLSELSGSGMQLSVMCSEDADLLKSRPEDKSSILGTSIVDWTIAACSVWPHGPCPDDFHAPLASDKPILILEGELDPVTPPRYGEQIVKGASNGKLIVGKGQGHGLMTRGCMPKILKQFVETLKPQEIDTTCADAMGPLPAMIDFNGATP